MFRSSILILSVLLFVGCSTVENNKTITKTELKYKRVAALPFVEGTEELRASSYSEFYDALKTSPDIEFVPTDQLNNVALSDVGIDPKKYTVIDVSVSAEGSARRQKIKERFAADAIILASIIKQQNSLAIYVQMLDIDDGELTLSFSKVIEIASSEADAIKTLTKLAADKVIAHIKDNVVITNIYKY